MQKYCKFCHKENYKNYKIHYNFKVFKNIANFVMNKITKKYCKILQILS